MLIHVVACALLTAGPWASLQAPPPPVVSEETQFICPVCAKPIPSGKGSQVTVRGHEYLVDEPACGVELQGNPDHYLDADGVPLNTRKPPQP